MPHDRSVATGRRVTAAPAMAIEAAALMRWVAKAAPGDAIEYARGRHYPRGHAAVALVKEFERAGVLEFLPQIRLAEDGFAYRAQRTGSALITHTPVVAQVAMLDAVFGVCVEDGFARRKNALGRLRPNQAIAEAVGLRAAHQASYWLRRLQAAGRIEITHRAPPQLRLIKILGQRG